MPNDGDPEKPKIGLVPTGPGDMTLPTKAQALEDEEAAQKAFVDDQVDKYLDVDALNRADDKEVKEQAAAEKAYIPPDASSLQSIPVDAITSHPVYEDIPQESSVSDQAYQTAIGYLNFSQTGITTKYEQETAFGSGGAVESHPDAPPPTAFGADAFAASKRRNERRAPRRFADETPQSVEKIAQEKQDFEDAFNYQADRRREQEEYLYDTGFVMQRLEEPPAKFTIFEIGTLRRVTALLNPTEFDHSVDIEYARLAPPGSSYEHMHYGNTKNYIVELDLYWTVLHADYIAAIDPTLPIDAEEINDRRNTYTMAEQARRTLWSWCYPNRDVAYKTGRSLGPPVLLAVWPNVFTTECRLLGMKQSMLRFDKTGAATRWVAKVKLEESRDAWQSAQDLQGKNGIGVK